MAGKTKDGDTGYELSEVSSSSDGDEKKDLPAI